MQTINDDIPKSVLELEIPEVQAVFYRTQSTTIFG